MKTTPDYRKTSLRRQTRDPVPFEPGRVQTSGVEEAILFGERPVGETCDPSPGSSVAAKVTRKKSD